MWSCSCILGNRNSSEDAKSIGKGDGKAVTQRQPDLAVVTFRKVRCKSSVEQAGNACTYRRI